MTFIKNMTLMQWVFGLGVLVNVELGVAHGGVSLAGMFPDAWNPHIIAWANGLGWLGGIIMTSLAGLGIIPRTQMPAGVKALAWLAIGGIAFALLTGPALAQTARRAAPAAPAAVPVQASGDLPTLGTYAQGKKFILRLPNPLGLPDPLCITDHPSGACGTGGTQADGGVTMSGDPNKDLASFLQHGGIVFIRDMMRADQYLSYPCKADNSNTFAAPNSSGACNKTELGGSSCLEAIIPVAKMVVNGPPVATAASTNATAVTTPAGTAVTPTAPADSATTPVRTSTDDPPIDKLDEGVVTSLAKQAIIFDALQSPQLQQGCGGFILQKFKDAATLGAGIMQFITTLGLAGA